MKIRITGAVWPQSPDSVTQDVDLEIDLAPLGEVLRQIGDHVAAAPGERIGRDVHFPSDRPLYDFGCALSAAATALEKED